ncbi:MAG: mrdA [Holophagaceae bacterium]|nr:mrdA [Holophagaceae bacterium]
MDARGRHIILKRLELGKAAAWVMILGLLGAYGWVQLVKRSEMREMADRQAIKTRTSPAPRGLVYDRNGNKLVDNRRALHLVIQAEELPKDPSQIEALAMALQREPADLKRRIQASRQAGGNRMVILQDNLDESGLAQAELLRARFPFLSIEAAPRRVYLGQDLAGHLLGYVGEVDENLMKKVPGKFQLGEIIGKTGLEASHNETLKGVDGERRTVVDHLGREVALRDMVESVPGKSVYLTVDAGLQRVLQEAFGKENGAGVVIDLRDGGILAMYSSPSYDPNIFLNRLTQDQVKEFWQNPVRPMLNRAIQGLYPPGSTFKLLTALAALDKGIVTPSTRFSCSGHKNFYGRDFRCDGVHGSLDLVQAIAVSCDIYFYELGQRLDIDEIHAAAVKYGLADRTGIDLPHESASRVPSREWARKARPKDPKWYAGETISVSIGQGANGVTPLSLARFYAALATRGKLLTPHLLYGMRDEATGKLVTLPPPAVQDSGMDPKHWEVLDQGLSEVVRSGTAKGIALPNLAIAGKTGTSQVTAFVDRSHYAGLAKKLRDNGLFAGYAPHDKPEIAFAVVVENAGFGASSAAPVAKKLCEYWFLQRPVKPLPPPAVKPFSTFQSETEGEMP